MNETLEQALTRHGIEMLGDSPAALARWRKRTGVAPMESCVACGAVGHGNISCERCVLTLPSGDAGFSSATLWWFRKYARTRVEWSPYP